MSTIHLRLPSTAPPLDAVERVTPLAGPSRFAQASAHPDIDLDRVVSALCSSKRIICINGAGVSTAAQIPDFRGSAGLFSSGSMRKGKESIKDLFHVKSLHSPSLLAAHHALISEMASLAHTAHPTPFHLLLKELDDSCRLLRVYTQNIDGLEERTGLRAGLPPKPTNTAKSRLRKTSNLASSPIIDSSIPSQLAPRVIPLHGTLSTLNCSLCHLVTPLLPYLPLPSTTIPCPQCHEASTIRHALCERQRRLGTLRPSVVLYGEEHGQGDMIGSVVERDIRGTGGKLKEGKVDFLVVAGTSLAIPGVKRIIKEMAKTLHQAPKGKGKAQVTPRTIFVNNEPPKNPGEWTGVFDVWVQADIQEFANLARRALSTTPDATPVIATPASSRKAPSTPRKKRGPVLPPTPVSLDKKAATLKSTKGKVTPTKPAKQGRENWLPTPQTTPASPSRKRQTQVDPPTPSKRPRVGAGYRFLRGMTPPPPIEDHAG